MQGILHKKGEVIDYTPAAAVAAGDIIDLGERFGIASLVIAASELGALAIKQLFRVQQAAEAIPDGIPTYWDPDGDPYNGTAGTGALTADSSKGKYLGLSVGVTTATTERAVVDLNAPIPQNSLPAALQDKLVETASDNLTLDVEDVGKIIDVDTDAKVITLPATAIGLLFVIRNAGAADGAVAVTVSPQAGDKIMGANLAGVDDKDTINTKATAVVGDYTVLRADGVSGYFVESKRGTWAAEA